MFTTTNDVVSFCSSCHNNTMTVLQVLQPLIAPIAVAMSICFLALVFAVMLGKFFGGYLK